MKAAGAMRWTIWARRSANADGRTGHNRGSLKAASRQRGGSSRQRNGCGFDELPVLDHSICLQGRFAPDGVAFSSHPQAQTLLNGSPGGREDAVLGHESGDPYLAVVKARVVEDLIERYLLQVTAGETVGPERRRFRPVVEQVDPPARTHRGRTAPI